MTEVANHQNDGWCILVDKSIASAIHECLKDGDCISEDFVIKNLGQQVAIPVKNPDMISGLEWFDTESFQFSKIKLRNTILRVFCIKLCLNFSIVLSYYLFLYGIEIKMY